MQDAFASVAPDGTYSSPIPSVSARFGTMVGGLTTGRMLIGAPPLNSSPHSPMHVHKSVHKSAQTRTHALTSDAAAGQSDDRAALDRRFWHVPRTCQNACSVPRTGQGAIDACKMGVTIATRYASSRPQVCPPPPAPPDLNGAWLGARSVHVLVCPS